LSLSSIPINVLAVVLGGLTASSVRPAIIFGAEEEYRDSENSGKLFLAVFRPHIQGLYETHPYIRGV